MRNNFNRFMRSCIGLKLYAAIGFCIILPIINIMANITEEMKMILKNSNKQQKNIKENEEK